MHRTENMAGLQFFWGKKERKSKCNKFKPFTQMTLTCTLTSEFQDLLQTQRCKTPTHNASTHSDWLTAVTTSIDPYSHCQHPQWLTSCCYNAARLLHTLPGLYTHIANAQRLTYSHDNVARFVHIHCQRPEIDLFPWQCRQVCTHTLPTPTVIYSLQWQCHQVCTHTLPTHWLTYFSDNVARFVMPDLLQWQCHQVCTHTLPTHSDWLIPMTMSPGL